VVDLLSPKAAEVDRRIRARNRRALKAHPLAGSAARRTRSVPLGEAGKEPLVHPGLCGPCEDCAEALADCSTIPAATGPEG
jgi:hypothetical protein